jgi:acetoin utilization deacetylase AcuC-like enzyme
MIVYSERYQEHDMRNHPENSLRLKAIMRLLTKEDVFEKVPLVEPSPASREDVLRAHFPEHLEAVKRLAEEGGGTIGMDTYVTPGSYEIALLSAGGVLTCVDKYFEGYEGSYALVRPPGHHAERHQAMGFCLFNNIATGAYYALEKYGLKRVMVLDFDVHHGNGTQDIFYSDPRVFYISLHQYPHYPGTGGIEENGEGRGRGHNLNIPLPPRTCDKSYLKAVEEVVIPVMNSFKPELVLVSAGYDTHHTDPLGGMNLSHGCYYTLTRRLMRSTSAGIIFCLEGGYNLDALAKGVYATMAALFNLGESEFEEPRVEDEGVTKYVDSRIAILKEKFDL